MLSGKLKEGLAGTFRNFSCLLLGHHVVKRTSQLDCRISKYEVTVKYSDCWLYSAMSTLHTDSNFHVTIYYVTFHIHNYVH